MLLIEHILEQIWAKLPLPILSYFCPILIIGCFLISFGHWLYAKGYTAIAIYSLSIFTHSLIKTTAASAEVAALIGGFFAPAVYGLGFVCLGAVRTLQLPYGHRMSANVKRLGKLPQWLTGAVSGCAGGVTGLSLGAVIGLVLFLIAPVLALDRHLSWQMHQTLLRILSWSMVLFGGFGVLLGLLAGYGAVNFKYLGDKLLIYATIQSFLTRSACNRLLKRIFRR